MQTWVFIDQLLRHFKWTGNLDYPENVVGAKNATSPGKRCLTPMRMGCTTPAPSGKRCADCSGGWRHHASLTITWHYLAAQLAGGRSAKTGGLAKREAEKY